MPRVVCQSKNERKRSEGQWELGATVFQQVLTVKEVRGYLVGIPGKKKVQ